MANVAIVLDERNILTSLRMAFEAEGFVVDTYAVPLPALPKLILVPPSVLILNGRMPGMHGIDFFLRFRALCRTPVIFLSASADEIEAHLLKMGTPAEAYVCTPFSQREIIALVRSPCFWPADKHRTRFQSFSPNTSFQRHKPAP